MACEICHSEMLQVATSMMDCSATAEEIATAIGFTAEEVQQHIDICCAPPPATSIEEQLVASDERLRTLSDRITVATTSAGLSGDSRGALQGLALATKAEIELRRRLEETKKATPRVLPLNYQDWDPAERERFAQWRDMVISPYAALAQMEPARVLEMCTAGLDDAGHAEQAELRSQLERFAFCFTQIRAGIKVGSEFMRNLRNHFDDLQRRYEQLEPRLAVR